MNHFVSGAERAGAGRQLQGTLARCQASCKSTGHLGGPSGRTHSPGRGGAWRCVSLGSVYVVGSVGAVCVLALLRRTGAFYGSMIGECNSRCLLARGREQRLLDIVRFLLPLYQYERTRVIQ